MNDSPKSKEKESVEGNVSSSYTAVKGSSSIWD